MLVRRNLYDYFPNFIIISSVLFELLLLFLSCVIVSLILSSESNHIVLPYILYDKLNMK